MYVGGIPGEADFNGDGLVDGDDLTGSPQSFGKPLPCEIH